MSQTQPENGTETALMATSTILSRVSFGLLLFAAVFAGVLMLSWFFLLPRLTQLKLQGQTVSVSAILPYEQTLRAQITELEEKRTALVLPIEDATYDALKIQTQCYPLPQDMLLLLQTVATQMGDDVAHITSFAVTNDGSISLRGDIRNVGPRSMTVLAQFVKELEKLATVEDVTRPSFKRESGVGGYFSPFDLTIQWKSSSECTSAP